MLFKNVKFYFALSIVACYFYNATGCYITNCPWGGKRSAPLDSFKHTANHECKKCAAGMGTCFGPSICCGPEIGCLIDTFESNVCKLENLVRSQSPCFTYGKLCTKLEYGRCATNHLCCNSEICLPDSECEISESPLEAAEETRGDDVVNMSQEDGKVYKYIQSLLLPKSDKTKATNE